MGRVLLKLSKLLSRSVACESQQWKHLREYHQLAELMNKKGRYASKGFAVTSFGEVRKTIWDISGNRKDFHGAVKPSCGKNSTFDSTSMAGFRLPFQAIEKSGASTRITSFSRSMSSRASEQRGKKASETRKDVSTVDDPFHAPTYNIPENPVTFTEGASYRVIILVGIAAAAGYAVFKELIFQPKEYKIFNTALKRIQDDSQVRVRIGSPITGYGQESRNRAARQRIPHRIRSDEDGIEHVEVNFYIRGPHGAGKVYAAMLKIHSTRNGSSPL